MNKFLPAAGDAQNIEEAVKETVDLLASLKEKLVEFGQNLLSAIILLIIGWYIVKFVSRSVKKVLLK